MFKKTDTKKILFKDKDLVKKPKKMPVPVKKGVLFSVLLQKPKGW